LGRTLSPPGQKTPFLAAFSIGADNFASTISQIVFLRITNKQAKPSKIEGITLEMPSDSWWPSWFKLCLVDLRGGQLVWEDIKTAEITLFNPANSLQNILKDKLLAPFETVAGWTAWECPNDLSCGAKPLRIGVEDAAGVVTWQHLSDPSVAPNLDDAGLMVLGGKLSPRRWQIKPACQQHISISSNSNR
jgi:hypothetical protein